MTKHRLSILLCGLALTGLGPFALAQHHGNRNNPAGNTSGPPVNGDIQQFDLAVRLQASPEQAKQFNDWASDTEIARKHGEELAQSSGDSAPQILAFTDVLDDMQIDHDRFVSGFTAQQKVGLKEFAKKASKTTAEIARANKDLKAAGSNPQRVASITEKINKSLSDLRSQQDEFAAQMGIQRDSSSLH